MKSIIILIIYLFINYINCKDLSSSSSTICRALSFSGAGDRGAYEAGVVWGILDTRKDSNDFAWQFSTGISAGAINAAGFSMFNVGDEINGKDFLIDQWLQINKSTIYKDWKGGIIDGLLFKKGIYDNSPLYDYLNIALNVTALKTSNRGMLIGATDITTSLFTQFNKSDPDIITQIVASASIPGIFPPVELNNHTYVDGGVSYMTPLTDTARLCYNTGASKTIIDAIIVGNPTLQDDVSNWTTIRLLLRSGEIIVHNLQMKDVETVFQAFPMTEINLYLPSQKLPGDYIGFQYAQIMVNVGYKDGCNEDTIITLTKDNWFKYLNFMK